MKKFYPLLFEPIYRRAAWGGSLLQEHYGRRAPADVDPIGESVELSDSQDCQSRVTNGPLTGQTLRELVEADPTGMVSRRQTREAPFPLRISFLDVARRLPLQVYPEDAMQPTPGFLPKAKMWYVVAARDQARIMVGIRPDFTRQQFISRLGSAALEETIESFPAEAGDAYYITAGRVHAIDAGNLILCVEKAGEPMVTVSDWGNPEAGPAADPEEAAEAILFQDRTLARIRRESSVAMRNRKLPVVQLCPAFEADEWRLISETQERTRGLTCHFLVAIDGPVEVSAQGETVELQPGRCCFLPAGVAYYSVLPRDGLTTVLKISVRA